MSIHLRQLRRATPGTPKPIHSPSETPILSSSDPEFPTCIGTGRGRKKKKKKEKKKENKKKQTKKTLMGPPRGI
jgi:hypothetical protein